MNTLPTVPFPSQPPHGEGSAMALVCPRCQRANGKDRRFCGNCGEGLWQKCVSCLHENVISETFCGQCGVHLQSSTEKAIQACDELLARADNLAAEGRFHDAILILKSVSTSSHPELHSRWELAKARIEELDAEWASARSRVQTITAEVTEMLQKKLYRQAAALLATLPRGVWSNELTELHRQVEGHRQEIAELTGQVRQAIQAKQLMSAADAIRRLAILVPHDAQIQTIKEKIDSQQQSDEHRLAVQLAQQTQKLLQEHKYVQAATVAQQIPASCQHSAVRKLADQAQELGWLFNQFRLAPTLTTQLLQFGERLVKSRPHDTQLPPLVDKMRGGLQGRRRDVRWSRPWVKPPERHYLDRPVRWWSQPALDITNSAAESLWEEHAGQLWVAYGLALQGLGQASISTVLRPPQQKGTWSFLTTNASSSRPTPTAWGVDLGRRSLKAVRLSWNKKTQSLSIDDAIVIQHSRPLVPTSTPDEVRDCWRSAVQSWLKSLDSKAGKPRIVIGFPGTRALGRFFSLPGTDAKKIRHALTFESKAQVPIPTEDLAIDYHLSTRTDEGQTRITLVAARAEHVRMQLDPFPAKQCDLHGVQTDALALYNAAWQCFHADDQVMGPGQAVAIAEVGQQSTNIVVGSRDLVTFRTVSFGQDKVAEAVAQKLKVTRADAEQICRRMSGDIKLHQLDEILIAEYREFAGELKRTIESFEQEHQLSVRQILGCGGGFAQHGLFRFLVHGQ